MRSFFNFRIIRKKITLEFGLIKSLRDIILKIE